MEKNNHRITHTNVMWLYIISEDNRLRMSTESPIMPKELLRYSSHAEGLLKGIKYPKPM